MPDSFEPDINDFLKDALKAIEKGEWEQAKDYALSVQAFDPENTTAASILAAAAKLPPATDPARAEELLAQAHDALARGNWYRARERAIAVQAVHRHNPAAARLISSAEDAPSLTDPQSGRQFLLNPESSRDWWAATISFIYHITALLFLSWLALDTLFGRNRLLTDVLGFDGKSEVLSSDAYKTLALTAIAGALGGTLDAIRSLTRWHSEVNAYSARFFLRDIAMPLSGAVLAVIVYAIVRSGAGVLSGDFSLDGQTLFVAIMSSSAIGFAAGFNSQQVYRWIDDVANRRFSTKSSKNDETPAAAATPAPATPAAQGDGT